MTDEQRIDTGWVKLFHPTGALVTFPISLTKGLTVDDGKLIMASIDSLITAGFSVSASGLEDGELMEEVSAVARREGSDQTPIVDFYSSNRLFAKKFMHAYLNTPEDVAAFEMATGIKLDLLTTYDGKTGIERTDRNAPKYIKPLPSPIKLVFRISPKWEQWKQAGGEGQEPHKRLLVRYELNRKPAAPETGPGETRAEPEDPNTRQHKKLSGDLITMLVKKTGLKPTVISPMLAKIEGETISFPSALKLIESNLNANSE